MVLIKLWIISIRKRSLLYSREFPVNSARAQKSKIASLQLPSRSLDAAELFVIAVFDALGLDPPRRSDSLESLDDLGHEANQMPIFDFSTCNQLPVVRLKIGQQSLWPLLIIEHNGNLFCGLPLIEKDSNDLIDHLPISAAFTVLQTLIRFFSKDEKLQNIEPFISKYMPFGQLIEWPAHLDVPTSRTDPKADESLLQIRVNECISSGCRDKETIFGTVRIENSRPLGAKASLLITLPECDRLNLLCSPHCRRVEQQQSKQQISKSGSSSQLMNASSSNPPELLQDQLQCDLHTHAGKHFHYLCDTNLFKPLFTYEFVVTRLETPAYKVHLQLQLNVHPGSMKFTHLNVLFNDITPEGHSKVSEPNMTCGQLSLERRGLCWFLGNRFPRSGTAELSFDLNSLSGTDIGFTDAQLLFKTESCNYALPKITADRISIQNAIEKPKLLTEFTLSTVNYKLIPNFQ